ncbi:MAG: ribosome-binding factor A [Candidatus Handelsmanbacteria bacterium RIFCSPLOWO2_12_FULL_64_10]|uniref:Ribosome-binding factor A n=1 Tax=Handelsmanbacteria sp. (strain RIFCSPLOWO2_12_FULL_64_10) TaxID=1817868 RepID=A0A1F6CJ44_HANXR|nr:MAG: ribosome-binding factor A [Candidatus Handelsmanbacteria bacterium RIFCSPLOWO2_12_FULL_64_10]
MKRWRPESVGGMIQQAVSEVIRGMKDPRIGFVTVTGVDMSEDLRHAKVYVSVLGPEEMRKGTLDALEHGSAYIRREVGHRIQIRHTPELLFRYDNSIEHGVKIDKILNELSSQQPAVSGQQKAEE